MKRTIPYIIIFALIVIVQNCNKHGDDDTKLPIMNIFTSTYKPADIFEDRIINTKEVLDDFIKNYNIAIQEKEYKTLTKDMNKWSVICFHYHAKPEVDYVSYDSQQGIDVYLKKQNTLQPIIPTCLFIKVAKKIPNGTGITIK